MNRDLPSALMGVDELLKQLGVTDQVLENRIRDGKLPRPSWFDGRRVWIRSEVENAIKNGFAVSRAIYR